MFVLHRHFYHSWPSRHRFTFLTIWYCWYFLYSSFGWYREIQSGDMMLCQFVLVLCCWWLFAVLQITSIGVCLYFDLLFHLSVVYLQVQHWLCVVLPAGVGPWMASRKSWIITIQHNTYTKTRHTYIATWTASRLQSQVKSRSESESGQSLVLALQPRIKTVLQAKLVT